ncbi:DEAD/DEAH box helicase [Mycolicibacterium moriokaense]|uniref:DEAD/DEAH box helicase n=1 Tax=Mycolicibacterium moriokaense TaxID=39691 RepID=A0AAD1M9I3_9MYCO|nr:DEAD/DEAH box helicase [Mycolicibacterium moriokaense]MCV7038966.1 DEAD/DEAH box helicase [Mycolicibacterium moriokaense]ORB15315.1 DEAD/DEAH box helicase [Mycolicibacterium moriokaense]BBX04651.1 DEAD/DEAH box helicase [Mycolicibacterium moriokaense]
MTERLDPLETSKQIEESYKRYLKTLLAPRDGRLADAFDAEIDATTLLTKGPILELTPPYETGSTVRQLIDEGLLHPDFTQLGFPVDQPLYVHQETAIRKFLSGRNLVVSTGTGSGKTESFLIPILNTLLQERANGTLGPGVRALLLYPMNALANDQLKRLRAVLGSFPDITFGRYTGETLMKQTDAENDFLHNNPGDRRLRNELLSREEMRASPPNLLLTNYAMLEYLLIRPADIDLFDGPYAGTWRFIVMDEAHVYDGAQGSEVALLLRRLKQRVAPRRNVQCIATSASLTGSVRDDPHGEAMQFASNLFDAPFEYDEGDSSRQDLVEPTRKKHIDQATWKLTGDEILQFASDSSDDDSIARFGGAATAAEALHREESIVNLKAALSNGPRDVRELQAQLWPEDPAAHEKLNALVALGSRIHDDAGHPVLSARYHLFVRATEGAFVSFTQDGPRIFLGRHEVDPDTGRAVFEFGTCSRCGAVHLSGEVDRRGRHEYFVPTKKADGAVNWLVLADADLDTLIDEDEATLADEAGSADDPTTRILCTGCGLLSAPDSTRCDSAQCLGGPMLTVREHPRAKKVMTRCTECGAQSRQGVRRLRTDTNAAPAVVTTALYQQLPEAVGEIADEVGSGRKLLMFSDSRQAAAFAAPYLDRTYSRLLERRYLTQALLRADTGEHLTLGDLAVLTREQADAAGHFPRGMGSIEIKQEINQWVMGELITLETRQSLEGLGLMTVGLQKDSRVPMRGLTALGLSEDEAWSLLNVLVKTARMQGAMSPLERVDIKDERFAPRNTIVRMRSTGSDAKKQVISWNPSGRPGTSNGRMIFLNKVLTALGNSTPAATILEGCWKLLESSGYFTVESDRVLGPVFQIDHARLTVANGKDGRWFLCDTCRTLTAYSVRGVCPNSRCTGRLGEITIPDVEDDTNHYRVIYQTMNTAPLSAKEHTAQWDAKEAARIQREFISGRVNVLSCSTTFELGVDVGDLQSVVMRNMPPKTANYVQRAGRAGRRAASAALVVTYANRTAHDLAKYQEPTSMIAGQMRIPWVPVDNARIARRHAHSIALAAYFRHRAENDSETWRHAGPFFTPQGPGQESPAAMVKHFLDPVPEDVHEALKTALPLSVQAEIGVHDGSWVDVLVELLASVGAEVIADINIYNEQIDAAARERKFALGKKLTDTLRTIESRELLGFLANKNVLPKYGFPVDTVELRTLHATDSIGRQLELGRDLSLAIYEYAPGNQVVAGGKVWTSAGLRRVPGRELVPLQYRICEACQRFESGHVLDESTPCPTCNSAFKPSRRLVRPEFGFIAQRETRDVGTAPPERRWHGASYVEHVGEEVASYTWTGAGGMKVTARAGTRARLAVVSDGAGAGFVVCGWCGWATLPERGSRRQKHQRPEDGRDCGGPLEVLSLGHQYQSDVAEFTFEGVNYRIDDEPVWLSALYALIEGASEALEISRDDIGGALAWSADLRRSIVLFDTVPGGAGAAKVIAANIGRVLEAAVHRLTNCDCGEETSCYGCLRTYRNSRDHELLSRGAALKLLGGFL